MGQELAVDDIVVMVHKRHIELVLARVIRFTTNYARVVSYHNGEWEEETYSKLCHSGQLAKVDAELALLYALKKKSK